LLYAGEVDFLAGTLPFLREGVAADEPVLVVVSAARIGLLRSALGRDADRVAFADMADVGANPARIISAWRDFVAPSQPARGRARGIGEPIWAARTPAELVECQRHETLLNLSFAGVPAWWLLCPYDTTALGPEGLGEPSTPAAPAPGPPGGRPSRSPRPCPTRPGSRRRSASSWPPCSSCAS